MLPVMLKALEILLKCYFYLNNNPKIIINKKTIIKYKDFSLYVILSPPLREPPKCEEALDQMCQSVK